MRKLSKKSVAMLLALLMLTTTMFSFNTVVGAKSKPKKFVKSIKVKKKKIKIKVGKTIKVKVKVKTVKKANKKFTAKSSKNSVASVKASGKYVKIKAKRIGKTTITVITKGKNKKGKKLKAKIKVTVTGSPKTVNPSSPAPPAQNPTRGVQKLDKIIVTASPESIAVGATSTITVVSATEGVEIVKVEYESSNTDIATVNSNGIVTGKMANSAPVIIVVKAYDAYGNSVSGGVGVTVTGELYPDARISDVADNYVIDKGDTRQLNPVAINAGPDPKFYYTSDNPNIAKVDDKGLITAVAKGEAKITVTIAGTTAQAVCFITVKDSIGIASFKATHARILTLEFTSPVNKDDRDNINIVVKKGSATMEMKRQWSEDGSYVDLSDESNLAATDYTVAISSDLVSISSENNTAKTTVEKYGIKGIKITTKRINKVDYSKIYFDAIDNYGDKINNTSASEFNWQISCDDPSVKSTTFGENDRYKDFITLDNFGDKDNGVEADKTVIGIQAILKSDATIKSGRTDIDVRSIKIDKVDIVDIELEGGAKHIYEENKLKKYKLVVDAKDNFGDDIDWSQYHPGTNYSRYSNDFKAYSDNTELVKAPYFNSETNELYIDVYANMNGKAKIYAFADNPDYKTYDVEVLAKRKPLTINFPDSSDYSLVAKEDKEVKIPITFTDQYGEVMVKNAVDYTTFSKTFTVVLSDNSLIADYISSVDGDCVVFNAKHVPSTTDKVNVTYTTYDDKMQLVQSSFIIKVNEERRPNSIKFNTEFPDSLSLVEGESIKLDFQIVDNQGEPWRDNKMLSVTPITTGIEDYVNVSVSDIRSDGTGTVTVTGILDSTVNRDSELPLKFTLNYGSESITATTFTPPTVVVYPNIGGTTPIQVTPSINSVNSGQTVKLVLQAMKSDTEKLNSYEHTYKNVIFTQKDIDTGKTLTDFKDVVFKDGIAEVEIEAKIATEHLKFYANIEAVGYGNVSLESSETVSVNVGEPDHFNINLTNFSSLNTTTVKVICVDKNNNVVKSFAPTEAYITIRDKNGNAVAPNTYFDSYLVDSNGKVLTNFVNGEASFSTKANAWFKDKEEITIKSGSITGSVTAE